MAASPTPLIACLEPDGANDADYIAAGAAMQTNLLSLKILFADKNTGQIVANITASAAYYNQRYVLTAAHNFTDFSQYDIARCEVGTGPNYTTNRGMVVAGFKHIICPLFYPDHNPHGDSPDIAIVCLAASLPGPNVTIGSAGTGDVVTEAGFGETGTPSTTLFRDRNSRAWRAPVVDIPWYSQFSSIYFGETQFYPYISLNGHGMPGDSGGPLYNNQGQLVGIGTQATTDQIEYGATWFVKLAQPDVLSWILTNTIITPPVPPQLSMGSNKSLLLTGDTNQIYGIEASTKLTTWQEIGLVTNLTGSVTFQDPNAAGFSNRFYRAVAK